jgi:hypothetical protein
MRRAACLAIFAFAPLLGAAPPATGPTTRPNIEPLIQQLGDDNWKIRQKAQDQIVAAGEDAVPRLQDVLKETHDEEVRARVEAALGQIAANNRNAPTLITLHLKDAPAQTVVAEIAQQAHTEVGAWPEYVWRNVNQKVTINADKQPFWTVMKDVCRQTHLVPEPMGGSSRNRITLMQRGNAWGNQPTSSQGCYLVMAQSAQRNHTVDYANGGNAQTNFNLSLRCYIDPKVRIIRGSREAKIEEAVDDKGNSLALPNHNFENSFTPPWNGSWCWDVSVPLQYRPDMGAKLARLRGSMHFTVITKAQTWDVPEILAAKEVEKTLPTCKYTIHQVTKNGDSQYTLKITITTAKDQNGGPMSDFSTLQQQIKLVDANGRSYDTSGGGGGGGNGTVNYEFSFYNSTGGPLGVPTRLVWEIPIEMKDVSVPIEFNDLPLP